MPNAAVVTISDRCFQGLRPDEGGPLVVKILTDAGYAVAETVLVPDEQPEIEAALRRLADEGSYPLIVTTGGTGFAPRDVTPEATLAVCERLTPGHALPGPGGHPGRQPYREPAGLPQGSQGKPGSRSADAGPRLGDALRPPGRLRKAPGLTHPPPRQTGTEPCSRGRNGETQPRRSKGEGISPLFSVSRKASSSFSGSLCVRKNPPHTSS